MKTNLFSFLIHFWVCSLTSAYLSAQQEDFISRTYSMKDGLSHNYATCLWQDRHGFLWVGTESGLNKFDGYQFTTFREDPLDTNSLSNNNITCLWEDPQQRLWVGSTTGLELFDLKTERFQSVGHYALDPVQGLNLNVHKMRERKDGKLWICTTQGIYLADPQNLTVTKPIDFPQEVNRTSTRRDNLNGNNFWDIAETSDEALWAASEDGLVHIDTRTGQVTRYRYDPEDLGSLADDWTRTVHVDRHKRIWVGTAHGLDLFNPESRSFTHFIPETLRDEPLLSHRLYVNVLSEQPDGRFWVGFSDGLYVFDPETGKFDQLLNQYTWSLYQDRQGTLWLGAIDRLFQIKPQHKKFTTYRNFGQARMSGIAGLAEDTEGKTWISGYDMVRGDFNLFRFDPSSGLFYKYPHGPVNALPSNIQCIAAGREGLLWMSSPGKVQKFNPRTQAFTSMVLPVDPTAMLEDTQGKLWVGEWSGLGFYNLQTNSYERLADFPPVRVYSFLEDRAENLWIGSEAGLFRYSLKTGQLSAFKHDPANPQSLSNNKVYHLMMDKDKTIWVGTGGGLHRMVPGTEKNEPKFIHWRSTRSGLPSDDVYYIMDGGDETLWIGCGNGITHFSPRQGIFRNYNHHDGLPSQRFFRGMRSRTGEIYFGSEGLVVFHPDSLQDNPYRPPVTITRFSIHHQAVPVKAGYGDTLAWETPLAHTISYTSEVRLSHRQNNISLEFAALNFVNPENNRYKYRLEPFETGWIETFDGHRVAHYTNLSPGRYTFQVKGANNDGVWNEEGRHLHIIIQPPWWQTGWAYGLYVLLGICVLYGLRQHTVKRERLKSNLKIKQIETEKLQELDQMRARFFSNVSHEFRTPLALIQGTVEKFSGQDRPLSERLPGYNLIHRSADRLLQLVNQLLDLSRLEAGKLTLRRERGEVVGFLTVLASSFSSLFENKGICYRYFLPSEPLWVLFEADKLEKILSNLLSNACKFTPSGGKVILEVKSERHTPAEEMLHIFVRDTGVGIPEELLTRVFERFFQADISPTRAYEGVGIGLALTKELVELHGGIISVDSKLDEGTTFQITLKLQTIEKPEVNLPEEFLLNRKESPEQPAIFSSESAYGNCPEKKPNRDQTVVLVVEDNADLRHFIKDNLPVEYAVFEADDGIRGWKRALELVPDLIISDVMMPGLDGVSLCHRLKTDERTSHIAVMLLTAKADSESKLAGLETGADDYLTKPFRLEELQLRVHNQVGYRQRLRERFSRSLTLNPQEVAVNSVDERFLKKVMEVLEKHLANPSFDIEMFSRETGLSRVHLHRKLKSITGQSPGDLIRTHRLKRAASLLEQQAGNISEVAYAVGFNSLTYFAKCFRNYYGQTPSEFVSGIRKDQIKQT